MGESVWSFILGRQVPGCPIEQQEESAHPSPIQINRQLRNTRRDQHLKVNEARYMHE